MAGSLIKRGKTWFLRYELPRGADGERRQKMVACPGLNKRQAEEKLQDILRQLRTGNYVDPSGIPLWGHLDQWLRDRQADLAPATIQRYGEIIRLHINPEIGGVALANISPAHIQLVCTRAAERGLSSKTVTCIRGVLHAALHHAVRLQMLPSNPVDAIAPPRVRRSERAVADEDAIARLVAAASQSPYRIPILIGLATGMRRGEVVGLKWTDWDPGRSTLTVRRSICQLRDGRVFEKETKTGRPRVVAVPPQINTELECHRAGQPELADWICTDPEGNRWTPDAITKGFKRLVRRIGLGQLNFHSLRHTQATMLILAGVPPKIVSDRLGHSTVQITQDLYTHLLPGSQDEAARIVGEVLSGKPRIRLVED